MNDRIGHILAQHYIGMEFISRAAGVVQTLPKPVGDGKTKKIPVSRLVFESQVDGVVACVKTEDYYDLIPDTNQQGILYFEDRGARCTDSTKLVDTWKGKLLAVCWLNLKLIGDKEPGELLESFLASSPRQIAGSGSILGGTLKCSQIAPKRPSPFDKYDYDEATTQHLIFPFDYFSVELEYMVKTTKNCPNTVLVRPINCVEEGIEYFIIENTFEVG